MSDLESASDYEVILEDKPEDDTTMGGLQVRALDEAIERMTSSTESTASRGNGTTSQEEDLMLASVSNFAPSYKNCAAGDSSVILSFIDDFPPPRHHQRISAFPEDGQDENEEENDTDESILAAHGEIKKVLLDTMEQMEILKNWKEEKVELQDRVATLEGTVDRLSKKNNALQKVNEIGTISERRRKDKEIVVPTEKDMDRNLLRDRNAVNCQSTASGISTKTKILFVIVYSLIVGIAVYYNHREADRKIQTLEIQVRREHWNSEQLLARIILLENRLNASFEEIHKLNNMLYSPYSRDIYTIPAENDGAAQEINCFIRLNSTTFRVCQRLADDLEREAHENGRLKEQVSVVHRAIGAVLPFFIALLATVAVSSLKFVSKNR